MPAWAWNDLITEETDMLSVEFVNEFIKAINERRYCFTSTPWFLAQDGRPIQNNILDYAPEGTGGVYPIIHELQGAIVTMCFDFVAHKKWIGTGYADVIDWDGDTFTERPSFAGDSYPYQTMPWMRWDWLPYAEGGRRLNVCDVALNGHQPTRKFWREIENLNSAEYYTFLSNPPVGETFQDGHRVHCISERRIYDRINGVWVLYEGPPVWPDVITRYGLICPGDILHPAPWLWEEMRAMLKLYRWAEIIESKESGGPWQNSGGKVGGGDIEVLDERGFGVSETVSLANLTESYYFDARNEADSDYLVDAGTLLLAQNRVNANKESEVILEKVPFGYRWRANSTSVRGKLGAKSLPTHVNSEIDYYVWTNYPPVRSGSPTQIADLQGDPFELGVWRKFPIGGNSNLAARKEADWLQPKQTLNYVDWPGPKTETLNDPASFRGFRGHRSVVNTIDSPLYSEGGIIRFDVPGGFQYL